MSNLSELFSLQFMMFAEMIVGFLLCKFNIVKSSQRSVLSQIVITIFLPCSIITSFSMELTDEILHDFIQVFIISCIVQIVCYIVGKFAYNKYDQRIKPILQYGTICSNAGLLGNAVAEGVYGTLGLMYAQIYLIPMRVVMWSAGVSCFQSNKSNKLELIKKVCTHPCVVAIFIGLFKMVLNIQLPGAITTTLTSLGRCATPCVMLFLGMTMYETGFDTIISKLSLKFCAMRLVILPVLILVICRLLNLDSFDSGLSVILVAMPAGTTTSILAHQYHGDEKFAANIVILSTLLSIVLLPIWVYILQLVF